jgi:hypothetical protein
MKQVLVASACCAVVVMGVALSVQQAASQPRITTTRQFQIVGAAASAQSNGAWLVDLQSNAVIFCERTNSGVQCHTAAVP